MKPEQLAEIEARAEMATPGPWKSHDDARDPEITSGVTNDYIDSPKMRLAYVWDTDRDYGRANSAFIAHARTDIPALCAEVRRLQEVINRLSQ